MSITESIILAVIAILALALIIRTIIKISKGESRCLSCKCCDEDQEKTREMPAEPEADSQPDSPEEKKED